ncbi:MAG: hypothetical protein C4329_05820 [Chitinophagaceae bacterium]
MEELRSMDIVALKHLYVDMTKELYRQLLWGQWWPEVQEQKRLVTQLAIELDKRLNRNNNTQDPATYPNKKV